MEEQSFYVVIPAAMFDEGDLTKACLYGVITSFAKKSGKCWASNKTLASKLGRIDDSIISRKITELVNEGYLTRTVSKSDGNTRILEIPLFANPRIPLRESPQTSTEISEESNIISNKESIRTDKLQCNEKVTEEKSLTVEEEIVLSVYNRTHGKNTKSANSFRNNLTFWLKEYTIEDIVESIKNLAKDEFWEEQGGMPLSVFFRQRNPQGEGVDNIAKYAPTAEKEKEVFTNERGDRYIIHNDGIHGDYREYL